MNNQTEHSKIFRRTIFLCACIGLVVFCHAQKGNSSWNIDDQPLHFVLDSLENRLNISFSYDYDLATETIIDIQIFFDESVTQICERLFDSLPLQYEILDHQNIRIVPVSNPGLEKDISSQIIDAKTKEPIPFVSIAFDNMDGTETDENGVFKLPPEEIQRLTLYRLGYRQKEIDRKSILRDQPIMMESIQNKLDDIIVVEDEPGLKTTNPSGAIEVQQALIQQNNSSVFTADPMRTIQLLPGVGAQNDLSSEIRIRGGDADESLIILDGMTLYEAKHYYGIFSTINAGVVEEIAVYKNSTPTGTEGRTSGVIDISTYPKKSTAHHFFDAQLGLMNASGSTVFSLGKALQVMAAARVTTGNPGQSRFQKLLNPRPSQRIQENDFSSFNVISQVPTYAFNDWNGKLLWQPSEKLNFYLTTFHSYDETNLDFDRDLKVQTQHATVTVFEERYDEEGAWKNHAYQVGSEVRLTDGVQWENRIVFTHSDSYSALESIFKRRVNIDSIATGRYSNQISNEISDAHAFSSITLSKESNKVFQAGIDYQVIDNTFDIEYGDRKQFIQDQKSQTLSAFASYNWTIGSSTQLDLGTRLSHYNSTNSVYFSPQVFVTQQLDDAHKLKASFSSPAQLIQRAYYEDLTGRAYTFWINANDEQVPVSRAQKWMVGYQSVHEKFKWDLEAFYKRTTGIMELASNQIGFDPKTAGINSNTQLRVFQGNAKAYGIDLLGVFETGIYTGQLSYTWSMSKQQFPNILNNTWIPARDDSRHQLKASQMIKLKDWTFQALWIFSSGRPYTDISKLVGNGQNRMITDPSVFQSRLKDYHRFDIGVTYTVDLISFDMYFSAGVLNVMNRRNVKYAQYIFGVKGSGGQSNTVAGTEWGLLDRTFNLTTGIRF